MRILITGANGQLGCELQRTLALHELILMDFPTFDLTKSSCEKQVASAQPDLVIHAAAYTDVDGAEHQPDLAMAVNVQGTEWVARGTTRAKARLIYISTDYVFDGEKTAAYVESDPIAPLSVYGRTKADGETRVREAQPHHVILRTSWVYGAYGRNFLKTVLRLASERDEFTMVADQFGCPTATADIAAAILALAPRLVADPSVAGTYHFAGGGETTWHGFATEIVARQLPLTGRNPRVVAITTAEYPTAARRPRNSVLDCRRFQATFGYAAHPWRERVGEVVEILLKPGRATDR